MQKEFLTLLVLNFLLACQCYAGGPGLAQFNLPRGLFSNGKRRWTRDYRLIYSCPVNVQEMVDFVKLVSTLLSNIVIL
jgi:hypothetical protein